MFNDCIFFNAIKFERKLKEMVEKEFSNINIHHTYAYILTVINKNEYVKPKNLANELCLDPSTVTRMVSKLEKDGYIKKGSDNSSFDISLTSKGKETMPLIYDCWKQFNDKLDILLGENKRQEITNYLESINENL